MVFLKLGAVGLMTASALLAACKYPWYYSPAFPKYYPAPPFIIPAVYAKPKPPTVPPCPSAIAPCPPPTTPCPTTAPPTTAAPVTVAPTASSYPKYLPIPVPVNIYYPPQPHHHRKYPHPDHHYKYKHHNHHHRPDYQPEHHDPDHHPHPDPYYATEAPKKEIYPYYPYYMAHPHRYHYYKKLTTSAPDYEYSGKHKKVYGGHDTYEDTPAPLEYYKPVTASHDDKYAYKSEKSDDDMFYSDSEISEVKVKPPQLVVSPQPVYVKEK